MQITVHSTAKLCMVREPGGQSVPARIWEGHTETGIPVHCYITRICPTIVEPVPADIAEKFSAELQEHRQPSVEVSAIPLRLII